MNTEQTPEENSTLTAERLLRRAQVEQMTGLPRASIYRIMEEGKFPRPVRLTARAVAWRATDVQKWIASRPIA